MSRIVIIEHDPLVRSLQAEWLTAEGYRVHGLADDDAQTPPPADLVIVDVYMPRALGVERLRSARRAYSGVPIIATSGQFRAGLDCAGSTAQALGVDRVIAKPFGRNALLDAVRSVIGLPVLNAD
ncbi:MAG TPA: response regulator [Casimicrobiaceae bacterium]